MIKLGKVVHYNEDGAIYTISKRDIDKYSGWVKRKPLTEEFSKNGITILNMLT